jgi:hypothetical protein
MIIIWFFAMEKGQIHWLVNGMDWRGEVCGKGSMANEKRQVWINPLISNIWVGAICVPDDYCPAPADNKEIDKSTVMCVCNSKYWPNLFSSATSPGTYNQELVDECSSSEAQRLGYFTKIINSGSKLEAATKTGTSGGVDQPCAFLYRTTWAMHKCVPWLSQTNMEQVVTQEQTAGKVTTNFVKEHLEERKQIFATFMIDIANSLGVVSACLGMAIVFSAISVVLLQFVIDMFSKVMIYALVALLIATTVVCWTQYSHFKDHTDQVPQPTTHIMDEQSESVFLTFFIICLLASVFQLCFGTYMYKGLDASNSIIKIATMCFKDAPQIMLYPVVHVLSFAGLLAFWLTGAIMLYCAGNIEIDDQGVAYMERTPNLRNCIYSYFFGLIWFAGFMNGMGYMIVAGTVYLCTFAQPKNFAFPEKEKGVPLSGEKHVPESVMSASGCIVIRYHMGTAALGALILSTVWVFRVIASAFGFLAYQFEGQGSQYLCCCCNFARYAFDNCLRYMNKMAYLQTMLHGYSFCGAAFEGLKCVVKALPHVRHTSFSSSYVLVVIKASISLIVTFFSHLFVVSGDFGVEADDLTYPWVPALLTVSCAYVLCSAFMVIFEVAIDAVMVAFCEAKFEERGAIKDYQLSRVLREHMYRYGDWQEENEKMLK